MAKLISHVSRAKLISNVSRAKFIVMCQGLSS